MNKNPILFPLFGYDDLAKRLCENTGLELGNLHQHQFPDDETIIRIHSSVADREVILIAGLDRPNPKLLPLLFAAETIKTLAANKITLIAPYLPYMRQDKKFHPGEGISSKFFSKLLSNYFDALITVDPHLHRWHSLNDIYSIPTTVLHASDSIADWIHENIKNPLLIGPDIESSQWVEEIAKKSKSPYLILEKKRKSDTVVKVSTPKMEEYRDCTPILVDDIISTAVTMIETVKHLKTLGMQPPVCIGIHAVFAENAYQELLQSGAAKVITCNTIKHISNEIDISHKIIEKLSFFA